MKKKYVIIITAIILGIMIILVFPSKTAVIYAEENYNENPNDENLYDLCKIAFTDEEYEYILKYFPEMLKSENFDSYIEADVTEKLSFADIKNIYIDAYLYACYKEYSYEKFMSEFESVFPYFVYVEDSMSNYTMYLQVHFWDGVAIDENLVKTYCDALKDIYKDKNLSYDERKNGYQFILEWYGQLGDIDSFNEVKKQMEGINQLEQSQNNQSKTIDKTD